MQRIAKAVSSGLIYIKKEIQKPLRSQSSAALSSSDPEDYDASRATRYVWRADESRGYVDAVASLDASNSRAKPGRVTRAKDPGSAKRKRWRATRSSAVDAIGCWMKA